MRDYRSHNIEENVSTIKIVCFISLVMSVSALLIAIIPKNTTTPNSNATIKVGPSVKPRLRHISRNAMKIDRGFYFLGAIDHKGRRLEGYLNVMKNVKPSSNRLTESCVPPPQLAGCRWKTSEQIRVSTTNSLGLSNSFINGAIDASIAKINNVVNGFNPYGSRSGLPATGFDTFAPDGVNSIIHGNIGIPGVLGQTIIWADYTDGVCSEIVEMDIMMDDSGSTHICDASIDPTCLDYESIMLHELVHGIGIGHTPDTTQCSNVTMFPYVHSGDTTKRQLVEEDEKGIQRLYPLIDTGNSPSPPSSTNNGIKSGVSMTILLFMIIIMI